jgi:hypothetical protein
MLLAYSSWNGHNKTYRSLIFRDIFQWCLFESLLTLRLPNSCLIARTILLNTQQPADCTPRLPRLVRVLRRVCACVGLLRRGG